MENRRKKYEQRAASMRADVQAEPKWDALSEEIDQAMAGLQKSDRELILQQYFMGKSLSQAADNLGITHEAARKRSSRAIERLRTFFTSRGMAISATALGTSLSANAVQAAPVLLTNTIVAAAGGTAGTSAFFIAKGVTQMKAFFAAKIAAAVAGVLLTGAVLLVSAQTSPPAQRAQTPPPVPMITTRPSVPLPPVVPPNLQNVRTMHFRYTQTGPNVVPPSSEIYFDQEKGFVQYDHYGPVSTIRFMDGNYAWTMKRGGTMAGRSPSQLSLAELHTKVLSQITPMSQFSRRPDPTRDVVIDGVNCRYVTLTAGDPVNGQKIDAWLDDQDRIRRIYFEQGERTNSADVRYDIPIDPAVFPTFDPAKITIHNHADILARQFPLTGALFTREQLGMIFAVHSAQQDESGIFHVILSARPTEATIAALGPMEETTELATFINMHNPNESHVEDLASVRYSGITAKYMMVIPDPKQAIPNRCEFMLRFLMLSRVTPSQPQPTSQPGRGEFKVTLDVAPKPGLTPLDFIRQTYQASEALDGVLPLTVLQVVSNERGNGTQVVRHSWEISMDDFTTEVMTRVQKRLKP